MERDEWIRAFAAEIGVTAPTDAEIGQLLKLASIAAHASERAAAPLACFVAGRSEQSIADLVEAGQRVGG